MIGEEAVAAGVGAGAIRSEGKKTRRASATTVSGPKSVPFSLRITGEAVSIIAMALTTLALGSALHIHAGFAPWSAIATAVAAYICMLAFHAIMPRHYTVEPEDVAAGPARSEPLGGMQRPEKGLPSKDGGPFAGLDKMPRHIDCPTVGAIRSERTHAVIAGGPQKGSAPPAYPGDELREEMHGGRPEAAMQPQRQSASKSPGRSLSETPPPVAQRAMPQRSQIAQQPAGVPQPPAAGVRREGPGAPAQNVPPRIKRDAERRSPAPGPREEDVEMIQGLIKKLADEVNAASEAPPQTAADAAEVTERAATQSVDALNKTAGSMREQEMRAQANATARKAPAPQKPDEVLSESGRPVALNAKLSSLAEALTMGRVEVLLDPIVDFHAHRPRHFEVFVRLRDASGQVIETADSKRELSGTGMLPRLDATRVSHASAVALRFEGRASALFSDVTGEALRANSFLDGVAQAYQQRNSFAGQLIMTFSQADVRRFGRPEWGALRDFRSLGFRYCIAGISDLDMDFEDLRKKGFEFVKLDADVFLQGLPAGNDMFIPAADICKFFAELRCGVIVGRIEDEQVAAKIFGFGVLLGQGTLFGGAKTVKREIFATPADGAVA